jgi:hypothetical protein
VTYKELQQIIATFNKEQLDCKVEVCSYDCVTHETQWLPVISVHYDDACVPTLETED